LNTAGRFLMAARRRKPFTNKVKDLFFIMSMNIQTAVTLPYNQQESYHVIKKRTI
jgi:hypothetical protein